MTELPWISEIHMGTLKRRLTGGSLHRSEHSSHSSDSAGMHVSLHFVFDHPVRSNPSWKADVVSLPVESPTVGPIDGLSTRRSPARDAELRKTVAAKTSIARSIGVSLPAVANFSLAEPVEQFGVSPDRRLSGRSTRTIR
jgi:hypothetical protein